MKKLSVIIPAYNEEKNLPKILERIRACSLGRENQIEWILVDNGSVDKTWEKLTELQKQFPSLVPVQVLVNQGYGSGILQGLKAATGEVLAWTHADCQTDPGDVIKAWDIYDSAETTKALVKGARRNRAFAEKFFSFGMQLVSSFALGAWFTEVNAQPKLFPRSLYNEMEDPPQDFSLDLYLLYLAKKKGYRILEFPVFFNKRQYGEAKGGGGSFANRWKLIKRTFLYIFELKKRVREKRV